MTITDETLSRIHKVAEMASEINRDRSSLSFFRQQAAEYQAKIEEIEAALPAKEAALAAMIEGAGMLRDQPR